MRVFVDGFASLEPGDFRFGEAVDGAGKDDAFAHAHRRRTHRVRNLRTSVHWLCKEEGEEEEEESQMRFYLALL